MKIEKKCKQCGTTFLTQDRRKGKGKFCSRDCFNKSRMNRETRKCAHCGNNFEAKASSPIQCCSVSCGRYNANSVKQQAVRQKTTGYYVLDNRLIRPLNNRKKLIKWDGEKMPDFISCTLEYT